MKQDEELVYNMASNWINGEIDEFNHNPVDYLRSLGWDIKKYPKIINLIGKISPTKQDILNLKSIIDSQLAVTTHVIEIAESNTVSDFLCNYVAGEIIKLYNKL